jgi:MYXO-CTERM domain-containing protein
MRRALFLLAALGAALLAPAPARADVVSPPPKNCPNGTDPETCHGPPHCAPHLCASDADCKGAGVCKSASFCVSSINCGGGWHPSQPVQSVSGVCTGTCPSGETCSTLKVCMGSAAPLPSAPPASTAKPSSGGSCGVAPGPAGAGAWLAALAAAAACARRRSRRR